MTRSALKLSLITTTSKGAPKKPSTNKPSKKMYLLGKTKDGINIAITKTIFDGGKKREQIRGNQLVGITHKLSAGKKTKISKKYTVLTKSEIEEASNRYFKIT